MRTIELDCPPGHLRPGDLIEEVVEGLGLKLEEPTKCFGLWTWAFDVSDKEWAKIAPILKQRITALYKAGVIRYGGW